ncbi:MAG: hypothetical protein WBW33_17870 [Bryobacteraceae bacterium]
MDATELEALNRLSVAVENLTKAILNLDLKIDRMTAHEPARAFPSAQPVHVKDVPAGGQ